MSNSQPLAPPPSNLQATGSDDGLSLPYAKEILDLTGVRLRMTCQRPRRLRCTRSRREPRAAEFHDDPGDIAIFSDTRGEAAAALGVAVTVPSEIVDLFAASGLDAPVLGARGQWILPVPAVFVIGRCGRVRFAHIEADPHDPLDPAHAIAAIASDDAEARHQLWGAAQVVTFFAGASRRGDAA